MEQEKTISKEAVVVRDALRLYGLETPIVHSNVPAEEKYEKISGLMSEVVAALGLDLTDDSLQDTPQRIAKMYVYEIFSGLDYKNFPKISTIDNRMQSDEMVKVNNIGVVSTCEHHFITIDGLAQVAYVPKEKILGLSKINRIVRFFSQRPQVQERLTKQILVALQAILGTDDVAVAISATHYCVKSRGVMDSSSSTNTSALGGVFKSDRMFRSEFFSVGASVK